MNEFIALFGSYEILGFNVKNICLLLAFIFAFYKKVYQGMWLPYYESQKAKDEMLQTTFKEVKTYHEHRVNDRQQSFEVQKQLTDSIRTIAEKQSQMNEQIMKLDERNRKYELSSTRSELLKQYRYFANKNINPMLAWTEMEKHAFDDQFESYIQSGGNSFLVSVVQPAMEKLDVILMEDSERIAQLYQSRTNAN